MAAGDSTRKDVYIDNTEDNSVSIVIGLLVVTNAATGTAETTEVYRQSANVIYSNPGPDQVQALIDAAKEKVLAEGKKLSDAVEVEISEKAIGVWDNRMYKTVEDGDAGLIGDTDYLQGAYGDNTNNTRTHIASGDYGKETHFTVTAKVTVTPSNTIAPAPAAAPEAPVIPTVALYKKSARAAITAAPGAIYQLDLGGKTGKKFKSSRKKVATVNGSGLVTIMGAGKTKITVKVGKKKRTLTVKDPTVPTSLTLSMTGINPVKVGDSVTLTATTPEGTTSPIKWQSSNKKVASVNNGVVTFRKAGKVTITATAKRGKKKAKVTFKVTK